MVMATKSTRRAHAGRTVIRTSRFPLSSDMFDPASALEDSVMPRPRSERTALAAAAGLAIVIAVLPLAAAQSDLDAFMRQVMERRDDNWKKLQQYILDEREELDIRGPGKLPLWGQRSD